MYGEPRYLYPRELAKDFDAPCGEDVIDDKLIEFIKNLKCASHTAYQK